MNFKNLDIRWKTPVKVLPIQKHTAEHFVMRTLPRQLGKF